MVGNLVGNLPLSKLHPPQQRDNCISLLLQEKCQIVFKLFTMGCSSSMATVSELLNLFSIYHQFFDSSLDV